MSKIKVLVIDDEPQILRALRINLSVRGYEVITAATGAAKVAAIPPAAPATIAASTPPPIASSSCCPAAP